MSSTSQKSIIVARVKVSANDGLSNKKALPVKAFFLTFGNKAQSCESSLPIEYSLLDSVEKAKVFESHDEAIIKLYNAKNQWEDHKAGWEEKIQDVFEAEKSKINNGSKKLSAPTFSVHFTQADSLRRNHIERHSLNLDNFELSVEPMSKHYREVYLALTFDHYLFLKKTDSSDDIALCQHAFLPKQGISLNPGYKDFDSLEKALAYVNAWVSDILGDLSSFYDILNPEEEGAEADSQEEEEGEKM